MRRQVDELPCGRGSVSACKLVNTSLSRARKQAVFELRRFFVSLGRQVIVFARLAAVFSLFGRRYVLVLCRRRVPLFFAISAGRLFPVPVCIEGRS